MNLNLPVNVLIIGGTGFIGGHVAVELARRGYKVILMDLQPPGLEMRWLFKPFEQEIRYCKGSINDLPTMLSIVKTENIEKVIHTSAVTDLEILVNQPLSAQRVMVEGHLNVMELGRLSTVKRIVFTSSIAVYAPVQYVPMDENHPVLSPIAGPTLASYSSFKLAAESTSLFYWAYHGVDCISLRLSAVYGFAMKYPMYIKPMIENTLQGIPCEFSTGADMRRDYTYIEDVVSGIALALEAPKNLPSRIYNITSGAELSSAGEVAKVVTKIIPTADIRIGAGLSNLEAKDLQSRGRLSIERASKELCFTPQHSLDKGICKYIEQYKSFLKAL